MKPVRFIFRGYLAAAVCSRAHAALRPMCYKMLALSCAWLACSVEDRGLSEDISTKKWTPKTKRYM